MVLRSPFIFRPLLFILTRRLGDSFAGELTYFHDGMHRVAVDRTLEYSDACTSCYRAGMRKQASELRYTIRGVPSDVDRALRRKAAQRKQSLNSLILDELTAATASVQKRADFHDLVGRWEDDPEFDETIAGQRQIDMDKWK